MMNWTRRTIHPKKKEGKENQDPDDSKSGKTPVPGDKE